jgi:hypothetical protein
LLVAPEEGKDAFRFCGRDWVRARDFVFGLPYALIDGFIVSPPVEIESVTTDDFSSKNTDHQLVRLYAQRLDAYELSKHACARNRRAIGLKCNWEYSLDHEDIRRFSEQWIKAERWEVHELAIVRNGGRIVRRVGA